MSGIQQAIMAGAASGPVTGQQAYTTAGTYTWTCPAGVTSVSVVCVGGGGGYNTDGETFENYGGGGALSYVNNISVTPGNGYTVVVGAYTNFNNGGDSSFNGTSCKSQGGRCGSVSTPYTGGSGGIVLNGTGGSGGTGGYDALNGGGGAGGYAGNGGNGGSAAPSGGGGGGGSGNKPGCGVGILGQGTSGGVDQAGSGGVYTLYGGGGASYEAGGRGAVRIIWPGDARQFPSTRTIDE